MFVMHMILLTVLINIIKNAALLFTYCIILNTDLTLIVNFSMIKFTDKGFTLHLRYSDELE